MIVIEVSSGNSLPVEIVPIEHSDFKSLKAKRYFFNWNREKDNEIYKCILKDSNEIIGLISIERIPEEWRIHIRLLSVSKENMGRAKKYDKIVGNLLTHVAKIAVEEFGELACISLRPKTSIRQHYIKKYNMNQTGTVLSLEVPEILNLINQYDHD